MNKLVETYHFTELIGPIDKRIKDLEDKNPFYKVYKVQYMGTVPIGDGNYISYFLVWYRYSILKGLLKIIQNNLYF